MEALVGLALLGQVACSSGSECEPTDTAEAAAASVDVRPIGGQLGARLYCIEAYESGHDGAAYNRSSGASGWLQWLPGTARRWGAVIGNRASEWSAAARVAAVGEAFFRSQWVPLQRGWC